MTAVEDGDNVFLLWNDISGFCLPPLFLVRLPTVLTFSICKINIDPLHTACDTAVCLKNRLSRTRRQIISGFSFSHPSCS